jgi:HEAT repeat protein/PBS lyase HEAT-like repeat-containing protein
VSPDVHHRDGGNRYPAIRSAREHRDIPYLIDALRDPDHRAIAAGYVADLGAVQAIPGLLRLLDANDPHIRATAARALGQLRAVEALPRLREIAREDEDFVRSWAVGAIANIGDSENADLLIGFLNDRSMRVRAAAALGLGRLGDDSALQPLQDAKPKLHRRPVEWYLYRRLYTDAMKTINSR